MSTNSTHPLNPKERVPWQNGPTERGGISIILACLAVIGTCTWTTLHLTIPDGSLQGNLILRKIKWMAIMVIFPEYVFAHAVLELKMALDDYLLMAEHADAFARMDWTVDPNKRVRTLHKILSRRLGIWPLSVFNQPDNDVTVTEDANQGTSRTNGADEKGEEKGSGDLSGERESTNLPYLSWVPGDGPKVWTLTHSYFANIGGIKVSHVKKSYSELKVLSKIVQADYLAKTPESSREEEVHLMRHIHLTESDIIDKSKADSFVKILWIWEILRLVVEIVVRAFRDLPITQLEIITVSFAAVSLLTVVIQTKKPKDVSEPMHFQIGTQDLAADAEEAPWSFNGTPTIGSLCNTFLRASDRFLEFTAEQREELGDAILNLPAHQARRIPNDYYRGTKEDEGLFFAMLGLSTVIFGAIHCGAWSFDFPTAVEKWAWRACAVAGLVLPVVLLMLTFALNARAQNLRTAFDDTKETLDNTLHEVERLEGRPDFFHQYAGGQVFATNVSKLIQLEHIRSKIPISTELSSAIAHLVDRARPYDEARDALFRWMRVCEWAQYPGFVIYLLTRLVLIGISLSCLRSAPRGIYWGTWANLLPAIR